MPTVQVILDQRIDGRYDDQRQQRRRDHAADDGDRQRLVGFGAGAETERGGGEGEDDGGRGHQHRAHADRAGVAQRIVDTHAAGAAQAEYEKACFQA